MSRRYATVTEVPGEGATREQLAMLLTRYRLAADLARGGRVLEVGCGTGMGLGYMAAKGSRVIGGDCDFTLVSRAREYCGCRQPLVCLDGLALPFREGTFDLVVLFEAIYYLKDAGRFVKEAKRVLRGGGVLAVCSANKEWPGFHPSPFSVAYPSAAELRDALSRAGFASEFFAAFPAQGNGAGAGMVNVVRRLAVALNLIPKTMRGKQVLKRIFYGRLERLPREVNDGIGVVAALFPINGKAPVSDYKVLYAVARRA